MRADDARERFPSAVEAIFIVLTLFGVEFMLGAAFYDANKLLGLDARDLDSVVVLLGNGALFVALMHYKRMDYRNLFHPSPNSVLATLLTLSLPTLLLIPALILAISSVMAALVWILPMSRWEEAMFERMMSNGLASVAFTSVLAPFLEEMLFRGIFLRSFLQQYARWQAIGLSAVVFGLAHLNVYQFVVGLVLGVLAGWLYERTMSLWPYILLHSAYNSSLTILSYAGDQKTGVALDHSSMMLWSVAFLCAFAGFALLHRILGFRAPQKRDGPKIP